MQIKNVKKIYDKNQKNEKCVLNDVSFEIKKRGNGCGDW